MAWKFHWIVPATLLCGVVAAQPKLTPDEQLANNALAERFAQYGQQTRSAGGEVPPAMIRQSAALLEEAFALNPAEPRFGRLLKEAYLTLGGVEGSEGAKNALNRYRLIAPNDQDAQIQLIEIYAGALDKAEQQQKYFAQILADNAVPAPVKAHVAVMAARLAAERGQDDLAASMIDSATRLFPLSLEALKAQYDALPKDTKPAPRTAILLKMLLANPAQPTVMSTLADLCSDAGLLNESLDWYQQSYQLASRLGLASDLQALTDYAAELVIGDQLSTATGNIKSLLGVDPSNAEAGMLGMVIASRANDPGRTDAAAEAAKAALRTRLKQLSNQLTESAAPTTQPIDDAGVSADVEKLKNTGDDNVKSAYVLTLVDLAWVDIFGRAKPADAEPTMKALRELLTPESPTLARLDGWSYIANGKKDEALVKLTAAADRDPLAQLGVVRVNGVADNAAARKLVADHPSGVLGAMLIEALRGQVGLLQPSAEGPAIRSELDKFPRGWLEVLNNSRSFYTLKAAPFGNKIAYGYAEPILVQTTVTNSGSLDLTVAAVGALRPDLWFDVSVRGLNPQALSGVAIDRLAGKLVLASKESITQIIRIDQGSLSGLLQANPSVSFPLYGYVLTNPLSQAGGIAPGPGGTRESFSNVIERSPAPLNDQVIQEAFKQVVGGNGAQRLRNIDLLGALASQIRAAKDEKVLPRAQEMTDIIRKSTGDSAAAVRAQALAVSASLADDAVRRGILRQMLSDGDPSIRAYGLCIVQKAVDGKTFKELAKPLADSDANAVVKQIASAMIEVADLPTPQPATQESTPPPTADQNK